MSNPYDDRLEAILREMEQQDVTWQQALEVAARLGNVELAVPRDVLAQIIGSVPEPAAPVQGVRA